MDDSIDSGNLSVGVYLPLIQKGFVTHMHETYLYKTLRILIYVFDMLYSIQCLPSFFSIQPSLCAVFDAISSNIDEAVSIEPSANAIVFGDFNVHHKNWVTSSSENDIHIKF